MLKKFALIFWNRVKVSLLDTLFDALLGTLAEYRRANQNGAFDVANQMKNPFENDINNQQIKH